jgi:pectate lyase
MCGAAMCLTSFFAHSQCTLVGWASQNGGVTGGGSATATTVSNYNDLKTAITSSTVKVVYVSGVITIPSGGKISFQDQSGKTIFGLPGSRLITNDLTKDNSGILYVKRCSNVIIRNLTFEGPGAYDVDGNDNMTIDNCTNIWVDHCEFQDGLDGNLDIKNMSDFITVTWCKFIYNKPPIAGGSGGSNDHRFSNLFGSSDGATQDRGHLNITMQYNWWAQGCKERMPRVRFGKVHVVNNYFNSTVANKCVMAGFEANLLVESNVFENVNSPIDLMNNNFTAITSRNNTFTNTTGNTAGSGTAFTPPYSLTVTPVGNVKSMVTAAAGATLSNNNCSSGARQSITEQSQLLNEKLAGIYPNPAKGKAILTITLDKNEQAVVRLLDAQGRLINNIGTIRSTIGGTQQVPFNLSNKKPGIYNVVVTSDKGSKHTYKLIVE